MTARHTDPETSHEAAESIRDQAWSLQRYVLWYLQKYGPMDDSELCDWLQQHSPSSVRTRRKELERMGLVEWTGEYGTTASGRRARLWRAV